MPGCDQILIKSKSLEDEKSRMKRIIADLTMQNDILKEVNLKKW